MEDVPKPALNGVKDNNPIDKDGGTRYVNTTAQHQSAQIIECAPHGQVARSCHSKASSNISLFCPPIRILNPSARPFIPGAMTHPPMPAIDFRSSVMSSEILPTAPLPGHSTESIKPAIVSPHFFYDQRNKHDATHDPSFGQLQSIDGMFYRSSVTQYAAASDCSYGGIDRPVTHPLDRYSLPYTNTSYATPPYIIPYFQTSIMHDVARLSQRTSYEPQGPAYMLHTTQLFAHPATQPQYLTQPQLLYESIGEDDEWLYHWERPGFGSSGGGGGSKKKRRSNKRKAKAKSGNCRNENRCAPLKGGNAYVHGEHGEEDGR